MALGLGKLKTLGLSVLIFAILVAGFDKTDDTKHRFQLHITGTRILGLLIVIFVVSNFKSMPFVWTVSFLSLSRLKCANGTASFVFCTQFRTIPCFTNHPS